jgi:hypothetical protein
MFQPSTRSSSDTQVEQFIVSDMRPKILILT